MPRSFPLRAGRCSVRVVDTCCLLGRSRMHSGVDTGETIFCACLSVKKCACIPNISVQGKFPLAGEVPSVYFRQRVVGTSLCLLSALNCSEACPVSGPAYTYFCGIESAKLIIHFLPVQIYGKVGIYLQIACSSICRTGQPHWQHCDSLYLQF